MSRVSKLLIAAACTAVIGGTAFADDPPAGDAGGDAAAGGGDAAGSGSASAGGDGTTPAAAGEMEGGGAATNGLLLGKGKIRIEGETLILNMSKSAVGKPFSLAPAIYYGVSDKLTIGVTHTRGTTMWSPSAFPGEGICLAGKSKGCAKAYDNVGIDALFGLAQGKMSAAFHGGLDFVHLDPATLAIRLGLLGKYDLAEKIALSFDPLISIGANKRDAGNKEFLNVPVYLWFAATPKVSAYVTSGIGGPLSHFGDFYSVPLGVGASFSVNEKITAGADFDFLNIGGKGHTANLRSLGIRIAVAL